MSQPRPQSRLYSTGSRSTQDALITASAAPLVELRQNSPQDCSNLIAASVDRATVEISRTIIALNATFSQQLQQASISASNGIKSAEKSASSSISIVSQNASSATSSASFSLNLANLAVTSVNAALTNANNALASANNALTSAQSQVAGVNLNLTSALAASTSDVVRLSSSLSSLEASLVSVQASASTAAALAAMSQQPLMSSPRVTAALSLAPIQLAAIVVGTMLASIFLSFAIGFVLIRARNKDKESHFDDKRPSRNSKKPLSRQSLSPRTGNSVVIKFSPPTSAQDNYPALERHASLPTTPWVFEQEHTSAAAVSDTQESPQNPFTSRADEWPLTSSLNGDLTIASSEYRPQTSIPNPRNISQQNELASEPHTGTDHFIHPTRHSSLRSENPGDDGPTETSNDNVPKSNPATESKIDPEPMHEMTGIVPSEIIQTLHNMDLDDEPSLIQESTQKPSLVLVTREVEQLTPAAEALDDPFKDPIEDPFKEFVEGYGGDNFEKSSRQSIQALDINLASDNLNCVEKAIDQDAGMALNKTDEATLHEEVEDLLIHEVEGPPPELPASPIFDADASVSEAPDLPEQSITISQQDLSTYAQTIPPRQTWEQSPVKESENPDTASQSLSELRDRTISPLRRNPTVSCLEKGGESQGTFDTEEREISPLRRNPPFEGFGSLFEEQQTGPNKTGLEEEVDIGGYESRGRSMIRTSDIIEARLSGLAQINKPHEEEQRQRARQNTTNDSNRTSVSDQLYKAVSPPKQTPVSTEQPSITKNPSPITSSSLSRPVSVTSAAAPPRRDESSPLRRNPPDHVAHLRPALDAKPKASSNTKEFSQALSKFQTLVSQNPQDAVVASNEVTSRAIAGIYIPGSLREQAVRNLSKSRERGTGARQKK